MFANFLAYIKGVLFFVTNSSSSSHSRNKKLRHRFGNWPVSRTGRQVQQSLCAIFWPTVDFGRHWNCALGLVTYNGEQLFSCWQAGWVLSRAAGGNPWFFHFLFSRSFLLVRPFHLLFMESMISEVIWFLYTCSQKWRLWSCLLTRKRDRKEEERTRTLSKIPIFERIGVKRIMSTRFFYQLDSLSTRFFLDSGKMRWKGRETKPITTTLIPVMNILQCFFQAHL